MIKRIPLLVSGCTNYQVEKSEAESESEAVRVEAEAVKN
jgi:hypothetical protein